VQSLWPVKSGSRFYLASGRLCSIIGCPGARCFSVLAVLSCYVLVSLLISLCIWEWELLLEGWQWVVAGCFYLLPSVKKQPLCRILCDFVVASMWWVKNKWSLSCLLGHESCRLSTQCYVTAIWPCLGHVFGTVSTVLYAFWVLESLSRGVATRCAY
jgi:hypothetical protein